DELAVAVLEVLPILGQLRGARKRTFRRWSPPLRSRALEGGEPDGALTVPGAPRVPLLLPLLGHAARNLDVPATSQMHLDRIAPITDKRSLRCPGAAGYGRP